jgi:dolichyl-phosphate-mannose--protein O-mannosyl transferase
VGYFGNLVPYELIDRSKFLYHYTPALLVGVLLVATCADRAWAWAASRGQAHRALVGLACAALAATVAAGFWYWGVFVYGVPLSHGEVQKRYWLPKW